MLRNRITVQILFLTALVFMLAGPALLDLSRAEEGKEHKDPITNIDFVFVKGGCFQMGDTFNIGKDWKNVSDITLGGGDERPVHKVCVSDFYMDKYEVTQGAYRQLIGDNPSLFSSCGDDCPVEEVSWDDANAYCGKAGKRLPTEAEWEYAARSGGKNEKWAGTSNEGKLGDYAWYDANSNSNHSVGGKLPNGLGLYDMSGNVWEWVSDWYGSYTSSSQTNPTGPTSGSCRVLRGGSWHISERIIVNSIRVYCASCVRASLRHCSSPDFRSYIFGFRCAKTK